MNNKISRRIKFLIAAVLLLFFTVALLDSLPDFGAGFKAGFEAGMEDSRAMMYGGKRHMFSVVAPIDPSDHPTQKFADGVEVRSLKTIGDVIVTVEKGYGRSIWAEIVKMQLAFMFLGAIVALLVHLVIFAVKFPRRRVMDRKNIVSLRWIAATLGVMGLSAYGLTFMDWVWLRNHVVLEGYRFEMESTPAALIVALILWVMTEILNLAGRLQNEQDLTI